MSIIVETFIKCDGNSFDCHENFGVDDRWRTGAQQRKAMKGDDWKHINGKDYCPECLKEIKEDKTQQP